MKILICSFSFPAENINHFGGKFVLAEAISYAENGANVVVLTPWLPGSRNLEKIHPRITVKRFKYFGPGRLHKLVKPNEPLYNQTSLLALIQVPFILLIFMIGILKNALGTNIIHAQWTVTALLALPSKWILGRKIVMTARGSDLRLLPRWLNQFIHSQVDAAVNCFGPQANNIKYLAKYSANFIKLPLIVFNDASKKLPDDLERIISKKPDPFIILYIGRFDVTKIQINQLPLLDLIHACHLINKKLTDFHVIYLGDGELMQQMIELISDLNLKDTISILGPKNNVFNYINACDLGIGGVAFNAVSEEYTVAGIPQILIKGGINADTAWIDGVNTVFAEGGNIQNLAEKIEWAIKNRALLKEIGKNAKKDMEKLITDAHHGGKLYLEQFQKLLDQA